MGEGDTCFKKSILKMTKECQASNADDRNIFFFFNKEYNLFKLTRSGIKYQQGENLEINYWTL